MNDFNMGELSKEKNIGNESERKMFLDMLGLPETATDEDMAALLDKEHKEFNLGDSKKEGGPIKEEDTAKKSTEIPPYVPSANTAAKSNPRSKFPEVRPEHSPAQVVGAENLKPGKKYRLHRPDSTEEVVVEEPPVPRGTGYWVKLKRGGSHPYIDVLSCQDLGVSPYTESDGTKTWNPDTWVEEIEN